MPAIECHDLTYRYGEVVAVDGVSFTVEQASLFACLGPNGAGKSTTIHMLTTLLQPTSGYARILGCDVARQAREVRSVMGVVFQEPAFDERLTAWENLEIHAFLYGIPTPQVKARVGQALEWAELSGTGRRLVRTFSGGMKRRLELARSLMHNPRVLVLDEPTLGLDPQGRRHLWERIAALRGQGLTVFMTTHYLQEAEICDRVAIMDHGKIIAIGDPGELKRTVTDNPESSLEDVFLRLTGRKLRDEEATPRVRLRNFARRGGEHTR